MLYASEIYITTLISNPDKAHTGKKLLAIYERRLKLS